MIQVDDCDGAGGQGCCVSAEAQQLAVIEGRVVVPVAGRPWTSINFGGHQSQGLGEVRGNGALVLTATSLEITLACPKRRVVIARPLITVSQGVGAHARMRGWDFVVAQACQ